MKASEILEVYKEAIEVVIKEKELEKRCSELTKTEIGKAFIDEIESIDRTAWELITKNLKGKPHGRNLARNI